MLKTCPRCFKDDPSGTYFKRSGSLFRRSTGEEVPRYFCRLCKGRPSDALVQGCYRQKKRLMNSVVTALLAHVMSQREVARTLKINFKTVVRKFRSESFEAECLFHWENTHHERAKEIEFDDLETFEHSKHKPLSVTIAVEAVSRRILAVEVSEMPSRGVLAKKAKEKYGKRKDRRQEMRKVVFERLQKLVLPWALIRSDANPSYPSLLRRYFPGATHERFLGRKGCVTGQGELKQGMFDPLFSINHTCAMFRANVNRLIRKTWCTTKSVERLRAHLLLYANEHNRRLEETATKRAARLARANQ